MTLYDRKDHHQPTALSKVEFHFGETALWSIDDGWQMTEVPDKCISWTRAVYKYLFGRWTSPTTRISRSTITGLMHLSEHIPIHQWSSKRMVACTMARIVGISIESERVSSHFHSNTAFVFSLHSLPMICSWIEWASSVRQYYSIRILPPRELISMNRTTFDIGALKVIISHKKLILLRFSIKSKGSTPRSTPWMMNLTHKSEKWFVRFRAQRRTETCNIITTM